MTSAQYQREFDTRAQKGFYPHEVEGERQSDGEKFRADWKAIPPGAAFFAYHGMTRPAPLRSLVRVIANVMPRRESAQNSSAMGDAARHLLKSLEALSETERREVLEELLRRAAELPYSSPADDELAHAADQVFQELDRREAKG